MRDDMREEMREDMMQVWGAETLGTPVVLVHGSGDPQPAFVWQHQRPLAERYRLLVVTRPGYGERSVVPRGDVARDVREIGDLLKEVGGAHMVGYSYGGSVAMIAAAAETELVRSLTVIEPPAFAVARGNAAVEDLIAGLKRAYEPERPLPTDAFLVRFMKCLDSSFPDTIALPPEARKGIEAMRAEPAPWELTIPLDALAATRFPKLVVSGNWSLAFEVVADVLTQRLRARRVVIEGGGHYILDTGERVNRALEAFLETGHGED